jgi:Glycine-zipper domain
MTMVPTRMPTQLGHLTIAAALVLTLGLWTAPCEAAGAATVQLAQYYPYGPPPGYYGGAPPCRAVNNPWGGAARGAAGGAIIGAIGGNAGAGAAAGAAFGLMRRGIQNSNARANGYCY